MNVLADGPHFNGEGPLGRNPLGRNQLDVNPLDLTEVSLFSCPVQSNTSAAIFTASLPVCVYWTGPVYSLQRLKEISRTTENYTASPVSLSSSVYS